jgi:hypothetical protein
MHPRHRTTGPARVAATAGFVWTATLFVSAAVAHDASAQAPARPARPAAVTGAPTAQTAPSPSGWHRWVDLQVGTLGTRYRFIEDRAGVTTTNQLQYKSTLRARLKFDPAGAYALTVGAVTGSTFTGSWNPTGLGTGAPGFDFVPRQIFVSAAPLEGVEAQVGFLYIQRGDLSEVVGYDNDGYLTGERLSLRVPDRLYFDEISVSAGYLGDAREPNVFTRGGRLSDWNYGQVLVSKRLRPPLAITAEYTGADDVHVLRAGAIVRMAGLRAIDQLRLEQYVRLDETAFGINVELQKAIARGVTLGGGLADVDPFAGVLNADRFGPGRRLYVTTAARLVDDLVLQAWLGRAVGDTANLASLTRFDLVLEYDLLRALFRSGRLR